MDNRSLATLIARRAKEDEGRKIPRLDVEAVLRSLGKVFADQLLEGETVRIQGLGKIRFRKMWRKYRIWTAMYPKFAERVETEFVENRKVSS